MIQWDITVPLLAYLAVLLGITWWAFRQRRKAAKGNKAAQYFLGNRQLGWGVLIFTLLSSAASAGTFIGGPGLGYEYGYAWVLVVIGQVPTGFLVLGVLGKKFAIVARKLGALTVTDFLRHRYEHPAVVLIASVGVVVFLIAYMVAQFVGGARILQSLTGVPYEMLLVMFGGIVLLYTTFGGFLADAVSDSVHGVVMLGGGILLWVVLLSTVGGMQPVATRLQSDHPDLLTLPGPGGFTVALMLSTFTLLGLFAPASPHVAVRAMSYRDSRTMHRAMIAAPIIMAVFSLGFVTMGPVARVFGPEGAVGDLALPRMMVDLLPGPVAGIVLAAPLAAIMSTVDSMILVVSSAIVKDVYAGFVRPRTSDTTLSRGGSVVSLLLGVVVLLFSLRPPPYLQHLVLYALGGLAAVILVPLVAGMYWKRGNTTGCVASMIGGMGWYVVVQQWVPSLALGMDPVVGAVAVSAILYVAGAYFGRPPSRDAVAKFWGTNEVVQEVLRREAVRGDVVESQRRSR